MTQATNQAGPTIQLSTRLRTKNPVDDVAQGRRGVHLQLDAPGPLVVSPPRHLRTLRDRPPRPVDAPGPAVAAGGLQPEARAPGSRPPHHR